jgi:hypothetical protein
MAAPILNDGTTKTVETTTTGKQEVKIFDMASFSSALDQKLRAHEAETYQTELKTQALQTTANQTAAAAQAVTASAMATNASTGLAIDAKAELDLEAIRKQVAIGEAANAKAKQWEKQADDLNVLQNKELEQYQRVNDQLHGIDKTTKDGKLGTWDHILTVLAAPTLVKYAQSKLDSVLAIQAKMQSTTAAISNIYSNANTKAQLATRKELLKQEKFTKMQALATKLKLDTTTKEQAYTMMKDVFQVNDAVISKVFQSVGNYRDIAQLQLGAMESKVLGEQVKQANEKLTKDKERFDFWYGSINKVRPDWDEGLKKLASTAMSDLSGAGMKQLVGILGSEEEANSLMREVGTGLTTAQTLANADMATEYDLLQSRMPNPSDALEQKRRAEYALLKNSKTASELYSSKIPMDIDQYKALPADQKAVVDREAQLETIRQLQVNPSSTLGSLAIEENLVINPVDLKLAGISETTITKLVEDRILTPEVLTGSATSKAEFETNMNKFTSKLGDYIVNGNLGQEEAFILATRMSDTLREQSVNKVKAKYGTIFSGPGRPEITDKVDLPVTVRFQEQTLAFNLANREDFMQYMAVQTAKSFSAMSVAAGAVVNPIGVAVNPIGNTGSPVSQVLNWYKAKKTAESMQTESTLNTPTNPQK